MSQEQSPATRGRNELLTALRDANEGWLPGVGKVFTVTLDPAERDILTSALSETRQKHDKDLARYVSEGLSIRNALLEEAAEVCDTLATNGRIGDTQAGRHAAGALDIAAYKIRALKGSAPSAIGTRDAALEESAAICDQQAEAWQQAHNEGSEILAYEDQALHGVANLIRTLKGKS